MKSWLKENWFKVGVLVLVATAITTTAYATSGACSDHNGVDCAAGPQANGNVICNDGWTGSSVSYDSMEECNDSSYSAPTTGVSPDDSETPACTQAQMESLQWQYSTSDDTNQIASLNAQIEQIKYAASKNGIQSGDVVSELNGSLIYLPENAAVTILNLQGQITALRNDITQKESDMFTACTNDGIDDANQQEQAQFTQEEQQQLQQAAQAACVGGTLNSSNQCVCPSGDTYDSDTGTCLEPLATPPAQTTVNFTINSNLSIGASGPDVVTLQNILKGVGFLTLPSGTAEGYFGSLTKQALINFQSANGLPATGYCGPMTRSFLDL